MSGQLGAEVLLTRSISVLAQYGGTFGSSRSSTTDERRDLTPGNPVVTETRTFRFRRWLIQDQGVTMGISLYL